MAAFLKRTLLSKIHLPDRSTATTERKDAGFAKAPTATALFPQTQPEADGDACLRDCDSCSAPLAAWWSINEQAPLYGHVKSWNRHLVVATGKADWVRDVKSVGGSVMEGVGEFEGLVNHGVSFACCRVCSVSKQL
jgi:hypothetical protein